MRLTIGKQANIYRCLQEITYLTSPGALNPLPSRPPIAIDIDPSAPHPTGGHVEFENGSDRPRKTLSENPAPSLFARDLTAPLATVPERKDESTAASPSENLGSSGITPPSFPPISSPLVPIPTEKTEPPSASPLKTDPALSSLHVDSSGGRPPSSPHTQSVNLPSEEPESSSTNTAEEEENQILTAVYRPDSKKGWRAELRAANEQAEKAHQARKRASSSATSSSENSDEGTTMEEQLQNLTLNVEDEGISSERNEESSIEKTWTSRRVLKSHLDVVRAVAFAQGPGIMLASAGDDCTVKVWYMDAGSIMGSK